MPIKDINHCTLSDHHAGVPIETGCNPFNHLPDELIQALFRELKPSSLPAVLQTDRRFHANLQMDKDFHIDAIHANRWNELKSLLLDLPIDASYTEFFPLALLPFLEPQNLANAALPSPDQLNRLTKLLDEFSVAVLWEKISFESGIEIGEILFNLEDGVLDGITEKFNSWFTKHEEVLVKKITTLDLQETALTKLPEIVCKLVNLKELSLRSNCLKKLPENFGNLTNLTFLNLAGNKFENFPEVIGALSALETLRLEENPLASLPAGIHKLLPNLISFSFAYNTDIPVKGNPRIWKGKYHNVALATNDQISIFFEGN